jgi:hypothetical protein
MSRKKTAAPDETLNAKRELFCQYYVQSGDNFGNATLAYAAAFSHDLDGMPKYLDEISGAIEQPEASYDEEEDDETRSYNRGRRLNPKYKAAYHVCSVQGSRLLRNADIQSRVRTLLNQLLKDEVVDAELAKVIKQDGELAPKIKAISEFNKLRGRIIDKTQQINRLPFGDNDLSAVIATLPQERQDYFYGIIRDLIDEAELSRRSGTVEGGVAR